MTNSTQSTTVTNIGVTMFTVSDVDAAIGFYTEQLGWEVRSDVVFGEDNQMRWVEVAPVGSTARLSLNPPMSGEPGGGSIGVETPDVDAEFASMSANEAITISFPPNETPGAPKMFAIHDLDGNSIWVVQV